MKLPIGKKHHARITKKNPPILEIMPKVMKITYDKKCIMYCIPDVIPQEAAWLIEFTG